MRSLLAGVCSSASLPPALLIKCLWIVFMRVRIPGTHGINVPCLIFNMLDYKPNKFTDWQIGRILLSLFCFEVFLLNTIL